MAKWICPANEPLAELIVADYLPSYGPEVWQLTYGMKQQQEKGDYWDTRVLQAHLPAILAAGERDSLRHSSSSITRQRTRHRRCWKCCGKRIPGSKESATPIRKWRSWRTSFCKGESTKLYAADTTQFLRAAFAAIAGPKSRQTMSMIGIEKGFCLDSPTASGRSPQGQHSRKREQKGERPADAPSLLRH